jgi:outer membrane protein OmpA-like peptidoglycan-associated protein
MRSSARPTAGPAPRRGVAPPCACGGSCPACRPLGAAGSGRPLPDGLRESFAPRLGQDLRGVRVHTDDPRPARVGAAAFTVGGDIVFGPGQFRPETTPGRRLLAHELIHAVQQAAASPAGTVTLGPADDGFEREAERNAATIADPGGGAAVLGVTPRPGAAVQRRLLMDGDPADVDGLLDIVGPPSGLFLQRNPPSAEIDFSGAAPGPPPSGSLSRLLQRVIGDRNQDAEIHVGQGQARVFVGLFPDPGDLTGSKVQTVDLDDVRALEAGAPGNGVAAVAHEIEENFQAHGVPVVPGEDRFDAAHERAIQTESDVSEELVGPGRRVARRRVTDKTVVPNLETQAIDYQTYYLVIDATDDPATRNRVITRSRRADHIEVSSRTVDRFAFGSPFLPAGGSAEIAAAVADVLANDLSTITIVGHADAQGSDAANLAVSTQRAQQAREAMIRAGVDAGREKERFAIVGRGGAEPAADNDSADGRARNRRVVVTITRPGP